MAGWILLIVLLALLAYIRLAPSVPARWHQGTGKAELGEHVRAGSAAWREAVIGDGKDRLAE
ncbi:MAG: hypothetical protein HKP51_05380, partial [Sulfitobacter sp.]|nr:hypothetical protein [Sulfitobacter sp.]